MRKLSTLVFVVLSLILPALSFSQSSSPVWFTLNAPEGSVITASSTITLRFGQVASTCAAVMGSGPCSGVSVGTPSPEVWTSPKTFTPTSGSATVNVVVTATSFGGVDPIPGVYKTVQIQEQTNSQTITINGQSVTVPGLSSSPSSPPSSSGAWLTLNAPDGSVITASGSITLRYGQLASTCSVVSVSSGPCRGANPGGTTPETWTSPQTFSPLSGSSTVSVTVSTAAFNNVDPLPGVYKTVQIQQKTTAQTIIVNGQSRTVPGTSTPPSSSVWFTLTAPEGTVITASAPITLRYGQLASTCAVVAVNSGPCQGASPGRPTPETWTSPQTFSPSSGSTTASVTVSTAAFNNVDPIPGVYKTVQIQEKTNTQTITVNGQSVTVPGTSTQPTCQLVANPSSINFQNTTVGYTLSSSGSITSNCPTTVTVSSVQVSGPYSVSGFQSPFSLASGQTQNYSAVFAPTTTGTANGTIAFVSNAATNPNVSVSLTGTGVGSTQVATLSSSATSLAFGNVAVNNAQSKTVTITNSGSTTITVSAVRVTGTGFSISSVTTPFTLAASQSRQITVTLTPTANGSASGTLTITSNASNSTLTVSLTGTGVSPANRTVTLSWNPSSSQVSGYNIYRSTVSGGPYSKINSSTITTVSYSDQTVVGGATYYYTITAVGTNGTQSGYSNQATVVIPNP
ncbi:choice-of-anchor D domain-containing protein [Edaphobacter modestus]|uniref:ASPM-SPD-2-Hydin domain-containing protein n=1 Tax=Edaphobacter modestus TaxID=388466 RepID=A0A4V2G4A9_9BACT|nr:choice-of-anchor D domain-containing protein [Edaphobacter modestus]RZU39976.1 ASPM-SPD-2-Hydin domain-containing protein [Edaphobacter modestus]